MIAFVGTTKASGPLATNGTAKVQVTSAGRNQNLYQFLRVVNAGAGDFFISLDGGLTYPIYVPGASGGVAYVETIPVKGLTDSTQLYIQRAASTDVSNAYLNVS